MLAALQAAGFRVRWWVTRGSIHKCGWAPRTSDRPVLVLGSACGPVPADRDLIGAAVAAALRGRGPRLRRTEYGGLRAFDLGVGEVRDAGHSVRHHAHDDQRRGHAEGRRGIRGMPIPGASVTLYSDAAGETKVGSGETEASGRRPRRSESRVPAPATTWSTWPSPRKATSWIRPPACRPVTWNPQSPVHPAPGANPPAVLNDDIVNLNVANFSFSGATITTAHTESAAEALAGWAISVLSGSGCRRLRTGRTGRGRLG